MNELANRELRELGRRAAEAVPDVGSVLDVEVSYDLDSGDQLSYLFSFLGDRHGDTRPRGLALIHLIGELRAALEDRGDPLVPFVQVLNREDWDRRPVV